MMGGSNGSIKSNQISALTCTTESTMSELHFLMCRRMPQKAFCSYRIHNSVKPVRATSLNADELLT